MIFYKSAWVHLENRRVLVARSKGNDIFFLPGGNKEIGETDKEALEREILEELSVRLKKDSIHYLKSFTAPSFEFPETVLIEMKCYTATPIGEIEPSSEVEEVSFLRYSEINKVSNVDKLVFGYLMEKKLID